jgi:hypothetical protein
MTTIPFQTLSKSLVNIACHSSKHLHKNSFEFLLNSMYLECCRGRSEDLCVKSVERWLQTARVTQSGDAQNGVDFFQWPFSLQEKLQ